MPFITTQRGLQWHYDMEGEGPALLFLHGWGVDHRVWRQQAKSFSDDYRVLSIDLPGHGQSQWQKLSLEEIARDICEIFGQLGITSVTVVASSLGGLVAIQLFGIAPNVIHKIVLVGSQPKFVSCEDYETGLGVDRVEKLAEQIKTNYKSMVHVFFRSLFTKHERSSRRLKWIHTFRRTEALPDKEALLDFLTILSETDLREVFRSINVPVCFINGTHDYICPPQTVRNLNDQLPHAKMGWLEQCGHFPFLSKPYEFNRILKEFLAEGTPVNS